VKRPHHDPISPPFGALRAIYGLGMYRQAPSYPPPPVLHRCNFDLVPSPLLNVRLPLEELEAVTELAARQGVTRSDLVRALLRERLEAEGTEEPDT